MNLIQYAPYRHVSPETYPNHPKVLALEPQEGVLVPFGATTSRLTIRNDGQQIQPCIIRLHQSHAPRDNYILSKYLVHCLAYIPPVHNLLLRTRNILMELAHVNRPPLRNRIFFRVLQPRAP